MSTRLPLPPPGFDELPVNEKLDYVQSLWDRIVADSGQVPVPDWHWEVLRDRVRERGASQDDRHDWASVRDNLIRELEAKESDKQ